MEKNSDISTLGTIEVCVVCDYCGHESNILHDFKDGWIAKCEKCGHMNIICTECEDSNHFCDWHMEGNESVCHRGRFVVK